MKRKSEVQRKTRETDIHLTIELNSRKTSEIRTPFAFFNHMLTAFCKYANVYVQLIANGDTDVDPHHLIEDCGLVIGIGLNKALGERRGIERYASRYVTMDDALSRVVLDISGRAFLVYKLFLPQPIINQLDLHLFEEFFRALCMEAKFTLHIESLYGNNSHHIIESVFKAFALCFKDAVQVCHEDIPSTKGVIV